MMRCKRMAQRRTQVAQQVPAVSHLNSMRNRPARGFGIDAATVTAHDLCARMLPQPLGYSLSLPIRQQINHSALLQIAEDVP